MCMMHIIFRAIISQLFKMHAFFLKNIILFDCEISSKNVINCQQFNF